MQLETTQRRGRERLSCVVTSEGSVVRFCQVTAPLRTTTMLCQLLLAPRENTQQSRLLRSARVSTRQYPNLASGLPADRTSSRVIAVDHQTLTRSLKSPDALLGLPERCIPKHLP